MSSLEPERPPATGPAPREPSPPAAAPLSEEWLRDFYGECGREITLAYTTLNQMKNWAIVIQAAIAAAVGTFVRSSVAGSTEASMAAMVVGAAVAYLFTLRFFIRGVICYNNLLRWNVLQKEILEHSGNPGAMTELIRTYYHEWRAPIPRAEQLASSLKLGYSLLFLLPIAAVVWGVIVLPSNALLRAFVAAAVLGTILEAYHFLRDAWFDDPAAAARRRNARPGFPGPSGGLDIVWGWLLVAAGGALAALFPAILRVLGCDC